jgi:hypothetical protein
MAPHLVIELEYKARAALYMQPKPAQIYKHNGGGGGGGGAPARQLPPATGSPLFCRVLVFFSPPPPLRLYL